LGDGRTIGHQYGISESYRRSFWHLRLPFDIFVNIAGPSLSAFSFVTLSSEVDARAHCLAMRADEQQTASLAGEQTRPTRLRIIQGMNRGELSLALLLTVDRRP
jgi:hypothetical protein